MVFCGVWGFPLMSLYFPQAGSSKTIYWSLMGNNGVLNDTFCCAIEVREACRYFAQTFDGNDGKGE